jgi:SAM-dependent methyltransferase
VSAVWGAVTRGRPDKWSVWRYHWLINHRVVRALERVRSHAHGVLLDVGCGSMPFAYLFRGYATRYLGSDLPSSRYVGGARPDVFCPAEVLPIRSGSIDTVLGLSMMDHVAEPLRMLAEVRRVLRPGGVLLLEFPQMVPWHDEPYDYFRYTRSGIEWLLARAGFETLDVLPVGGLMCRVGTTLTEGLNRINRGPTRVLTEIPVRLLYVGIHVVFEVLDRVWFTPREVIAHVVVARPRPGGNPPAP